MRQPKVHPDPADFTRRRIELGGAILFADISGALWWPAQRTLMVADLHLEKGSSRAARGHLIPPYDTRATLLKLAEAVDRYCPATVVALGDSFHDPVAVDRISPEDLDLLRLMQDEREWIWVTGNHDPQIDGRLGGASRSELSVGGLTLRHMPEPGRISNEIAGHLHPAARVAIQGTMLRRRCFAGNGERLVMPAFGAFTGGLNVMDEAFDPVFGTGALAVWLLGDEGVYPLAARLLCSD